jgi:hypothetical protein
MMMCSRKNFIVAVIGSLLVAGCASKPPEKPRAVVPPLPVPKLGPKQSVVTLKPTNVSRPGPFNINDGWAPPKPESLSRGELDVGTEHVVLYVPTYGPYSTKSEDQHSFSNSSTAISVDADNDNNVDDSSEKWFTSLPVRLGDAMFDVKQFDPGGTWMIIEESKAPLAGCVVGKKCPDFEFTTTDGKKVSLDTYKGKVLLLDVWSMT